MLVIAEKQFVIFFQESFFSSCTIRTDDDSAALTECGGDRLVAFIIVVTHEVDSFLCAHVGVCMCVCMCVSVCVIHSLHWRHQS